MFSLTFEANRDLSLHIRDDSQRPFGFEGTEEKFLQ